MAHGVQKRTGGVTVPQVPMQGVLTERVLPAVAAMLSLLVLALLLLALLLRTALLQAWHARHREGA